MSGEETFKERFRQAREKRGQRKVPIPAKRKQRQAEDPAYNEPETPISVSNSEERDSDVQTAVPLTKKSRTIESEDEKSSMLATVEETVEKSQMTDVSVEAVDNGEEGIPDDFFEFDRKKRQAKDRQNMMHQLTEVEFTKYKKEIERTMEQNAQEAAKDEQETTENLLLLEQQEQNQRIELVQNLKFQRAENIKKSEVHPSSNLTNKLTKASDQDSDSESEDFIEDDWRVRKIA